MGLEPTLLLEDPDFKSEKLRLDTSCPILICGLVKPRTRSSQYPVSWCVQVCPTLYCCRIAARDALPWFLSPVSLRVS